MVDFSNIEALQEKGDTVRSFTFDEIQGQPTIESKPATEANKPFNSARIKGLRKRTNNGRKMPKLTEATTIEARRSDMKLFADHCITGWSVAPVDAKGNEVEFTKGNCLEFLHAIPTGMQDDFRAWITEGEQFTDDNWDEGEDDLTVGNSQASSQTTSGGNSDTAGTDTP